MYAKSISLLLVSAYCVAGQPGTARVASLRQPSLGFIFDSVRHGFRPILGIPGAALLGEPDNYGLDIVDAAVSPRQNYAVLLTRSGAPVQLLRFDDQTLAPLDLAGPAPDRIALSPAGSAAAFYSTPGIVRVLAGLPDSPTVKGEFQTGAPAALTGVFAVADDGSIVIASIAGQDGEGLWLLGPDGPKQLDLTGAFSSIAFQNQSHDVVIADAANDKIMLLRNPDGAAEYRLLATRNNGISRPVAVAFSADNRRAYVANAEPPGVAVVDLTGGNISLTPARQDVTGLSALDGDDVFRLNDPSEKGVSMFQAAADPPRIVFVPLDRGGPQ